MSGKGYYQVATHIFMVEKNMYLPYFYTCQLTAWNTGLRLNTLMATLAALDFN